MGLSFLASPGSQFKVIAVLHNSLPLIIPEMRTILWGLVSDGFGGAHSSDEITDKSRTAVEFFIISGNLMYILGMAMSAYVKDTKKPVPSSIGYALMATSVVGWFFDPISGK